MKYRPWGELEWVLSLSSQKPWRFVGVVGTEERSLSAWEHSKNLGLIQDEFFLTITDSYSEKYEKAIRDSLGLRISTLRAKKGDVESVEHVALMTELFKIVEYAKRVAEGCSSVILDITSFPKRFFFPILRHLFESDGVRNLVVTYTLPESHAPAGEPLYEDTAQAWRALPGFAGSGDDNHQWIVSVGFMVESLRQYVGEDSSRMKLLIPFPAPLAAVRRTWEAVANLEQGQTEDRFEKFRVDTLNLSAAFDRITTISKGSNRPVAFAPFGPKPTSAAICLFATQTKSPVYYQQPTIYNPDYSRGVHKGDLTAAVKAYWIKHEGENLYKI